MNKLYKKYPPLKLENVVEKIYDPYNNSQNNRKNSVIIIPTYNQKQMTLRYIEHLKNISNDFDIIIIDNNSDDDTFNYLLQRYTDVIIIRTKFNYGSSGAQYIGGLYAYKKGYDYIIFSDNDAVLLSRCDIIKLFLKKMSLLDKENTLLHPINVNLEAYHEEIEIKEVNSYGFWFKTVHRDFIKKHGLPWFYFFLFLDDVEYSFRGKSYVIPYIEIFHPVKNITASRLYYLVRNTLLVGSLTNSPLLLTLYKIYWLFILFVTYLFLFKIEYLYAELKGIIDFIFNRYGYSRIHCNENVTFITLEDCKTKLREFDRFILLLPTSNNKLKERILETLGSIINEYVVISVHPKDIFSNLSVLLKSFNTPILSFGFPSEISYAYTMLAPSRIKIFVDTENNAILETTSLLTYGIKLIVLPLMFIFAIGLFLFVFFKVIINRYVYHLTFDGFGVELLEE